MDHQANCWGVSACIDLYDCDLNLMQDEAAIKRFVRELCDLIQMRRFGETQVVRFGDDPRVTGFSMTQLIETSLISAHFADNSRAIYLDVFTARPTTRTKRLISPHASLRRSTVTCRRSRGADSGKIGEPPHEYGVGLPMRRA